MSSNINKKKISFFINRKFFKYITVSIILCLFVVYFYHELIKRDKLYNFIQNISEKYNYQLTSKQYFQTLFFDNLLVLAIKRVQSFPVEN